MNKRIFKYKLSTEQGAKAQGWCYIKAPESMKWLSVQMPYRGDHIYAWGLFDEDDKSTAEHRFRLVYTGTTFKMHEDEHYLATVIDDIGLVYHVFYGGVVIADNR